MKYFINKILVVEGKEDQSYLSSFIDAEFVTTNGYDIPKEEVDYLNHAYKYKEILVLVDPDKAGLTIKERLLKILKKATVIDIDISKCIRGKKDGVAECDKDELIRLLKPHFSDKNNKNVAVLPEKLTKIDLSNKKLRSYICDKFHLGKCNNKKLFQRIKTLQISEKELMEEINNYGNK